jgi:hypothetical protein
MCWAEGRLCSSDRAEICRAMTVSNTFPSESRRAMGHQALGAEQSPCLAFVGGQCCSDKMRWGGKKS